eukprot:m.527045 g.527045  ORF g.527045 m.527045 type:complete len:114 (-) comp22008_c0_seq6:1261-1602(-)
MQLYSLDRVQWNSKPRNLATNQCQQLARYPIDVSRKQTQVCIPRLSSRGALQPRWYAQQDVHDPAVWHLGDDGTAHDAMDAYENKNLVGDPQHASMRQELFSLLDNRFNTPPV